VSYRNIIIIRKNNMSNSLERLTMSIPIKTLDATKFIYLCLKKLEMGQILEGIVSMSTVVDLYFTRHVYKYKSNNNNWYRDSVDKIAQVDYNSKNNSKIDENQTPKVMSFKLRHTIPIDLELKEKYKPYILTDDKEINVLSICSFDFKIDNKKNNIIVDDTLKQKIKEKMLNVKFEQMTLDSSFSLLCYIDSISHSKYVTDIGTNSINQYAKLKKFINHITENQIGIPKEENVRKVIDILLEIKETLIKLNSLDVGVSIKSSIYSVEYVKNFNSVPIRLKLGSFTLFTDDHLEQFYYIFHPGLQLFVRYLEITNNLNQFELTLQKQIFKKL